MKYFLVLSAVILAAAAKPAEFEAFDLGLDGVFVEDAAIFDGKPDFSQDDGSPNVTPTYAGDEIDLSRQPGAFSINPNFTNARVPFGQAGFAATSGGTHGGNGGAVWTVWDGWALRDAVTGNDRRVIYVRGRIDLTQQFSASPGVRFDVGRQKTIIGGDRNAMIFGGGLNVRNTNQVIIENIRFHNALSFAPGERPNGNGGIIGQVPGAWSTIDALGIENSEFVWVHHCEFADDPWISANTPENMRRHDGLIDITRGASWVSISNSIFRNHEFVSLVGNDDNMTSDRGRLKVTWYHNWFQGVSQRNPRVRHGEVHVVNNLYTDVTSYGIGVGVGASIYVERNFFRNTRRAWGWASGVANPPGFLFPLNNWLANSGHDSGILASGVTWRPYHYYALAAMAAGDVENYVRTHAGPR